MIATYRGDWSAMDAFRGLARHRGAALTNRAPTDPQMRHARDCAERAENWLPRSICSQPRAVRGSIRADSGPVFRLPFRIASQGFASATGSTALLRQRHISWGLLVSPGRYLPAIRNLDSGAVRLSQRGPHSRTIPKGTLLREVGRSHADACAVSHKTKQPKEVPTCLA